MFSSGFLRLTALVVCLAAAAFLLLYAAPASSPIHFELTKIPFRLENDETPGKNAPESMAGGVAVFDYNGDGRPDIFFANGANIATLKKDDPKYRNRLFRNNADGTFTDVTDAAGLAGTGYDIGVAVGDYDNDGCPDLFVAGVHRNTLYHNNCNGTFTDVTQKAGLGDSSDPQYGPLWAEAAAWVDVNNDGLLDLFIVDYMQWTYGAQALCHFGDVADYCHPRYYKGQPDRLFLNNGDGTFREVSKEWGLRDHVGKGMGVGVADYDLDGKQDLFVTNDAEYNFLFHNLGNKFEEVAFDAGVALPEGGQFISGMGLDFRDFNNDGYPDLAFVALNNQTFPLFQNTGKGDFREVTTPSGMRDLTMKMSGFGAALYDFDNDGWKDLVVANGHVYPQVDHASWGTTWAQRPLLFRNIDGKKFELEPAVEGTGLAKLFVARGLAVGDLFNDGKLDVVINVLDSHPALLRNVSADTHHWVELKLVGGPKSPRDAIGATVYLTAGGKRQRGDVISGGSYASTHDPRLHFGLGDAVTIDSVEVHWPSGAKESFTIGKPDQIVTLIEGKGTKP